MKAALIPILGALAGLAAAVESPRCDTPNADEVASADDCQGVFDELHDDPDGEIEMKDKDIWVGAACSAECKISVKPTEDNSSYSKREILMDAKSIVSLCASDGPFKGEATLGGSYPVVSIFKSKESC